MSLIIYLQLEVTAANNLEISYKPHLDTEITEMSHMYQNINLTTDDPRQIFPIHL